MRGDFFCPFATESQASHTNKDPFYKTDERSFFKLSTAYGLRRFLYVLFKIIIMACDPE